MWIESKNMDPLENICPELYDLVFQHLSTRELISKSTVSRMWHEEIGNSQCMKRIKIFIYHSSQDELNDSLIRLFSSKRHYRNVSVNLSTLIFEEKVEQFAKKCDIKYRNVKYSDAKLLNSLWPVELVEHSVSSLNLCNIIGDFECELKKNFNFPKLKKLTLFQNSDNVNDCFVDCKNLTTLDYTEKQNNGHKLIERLLLENASLQSLDLRLVNSGSALHKIITRCNFRLNKLSFHASRLNERMSNDNREFLCELLSSQRKHLEQLSIEQWTGINALEIIFDMEKLRNLSLNIYHNDDNIQHFQINVNHTINRIDICDMLETNSTVLFKILKAVPNLVIYKTSLLQYDDMLVLKKKCKKLSELYAEVLATSILPPSNDFFSKLTIFKSLDMDSELIASILWKDEEKRSHFERLILKNVSKHCLAS